MSTDGGGLTVFQRRQGGSQNLYLGWSDYKAGFGDLDGEFWLGLNKINRLSQSGQNVLRVDLMDFSGAERYAKYATFNVADESDKFRLNVVVYSGILRLIIFSSQSIAMREIDEGRYFFSKCYLFLKFFIFLLLAPILLGSSHCVYYHDCQNVFPF